MEKRVPSYTYPFRLMDHATNERLFTIDKIPTGLFRKEKFVIELNPEARLGSMTRFVQWNCKEGGRFKDRAAAQLVSMIEKAMNSPSLSSFMETDEQEANTPLWVDFALGVAGQSRRE